VAANGEHLMQDTGPERFVGSTNRNLTILQLVGVPVGALAGANRLSAGAGEVRSGR